MKIIIPGCIAGSTTNTACIGDIVPSYNYTDGTRRNDMEAIQVRPKDSKTKYFSYKKFLNDVLEQNLPCTWLTKKGENAILTLIV
jgi:hypothetical protein